MTSKSHIIFYLLMVFISPLCAQYAPAAGQPGTTAIHKDDSTFIEWANGCTLQRGWQNIADTALGLTTVGDEISATGKVGENGIVSLGDGGVATLTFQYPIYNGTGFDFAVFENGFPTGDSALAFLEFGFVEVSSDGINFVRFAASSNIQDTAQLAMVGIDCRLVNNLAGKYTNGYGTPFDLDELKNESGLDVNNITHVRIIDAVGSVNPLYATYDTAGHKINDPYPTPFASSGFDLEAVGVIHAVGISGIDNMANAGVKIYPNPTKDVLHINVSSLTETATVNITDISGRNVAQSIITSSSSTVNLPLLNTGIYFITVETSGLRSVSKIMIE